MKNAVLFGAGQTGAMILRLLSPDYIPLCFADNSSLRRGTDFCGLPVLSPEEALSQNPDTVFLCVMDPERIEQMTKQLHELDYSGEILSSEALDAFDARCATMRLLAKQITDRNIPGDIAEVGVYKGAFASRINEALPGRAFHLFDTFEGFSEHDVTIETARGLSQAKVGDFSDTSEDSVRRMLPHPEQAAFHKGFFPDTFAGCEENVFCLVSVDADLYAPTTAALLLFYDRLAPGGALILHDVNSLQYTGAGKAVDEFCRSRGIYPVPLCDLHGTVVLMKQS